MGSLARAFNGHALLALLLATTACTGIRRQLYVDYAEPARRLRSPVSLNVASEQRWEVPNELLFELAVSPPRDSAILIVLAKRLMLSDSSLASVLDSSARAELTEILRDEPGPSRLPRAIEVDAERGPVDVLDSLFLMRATLRPALSVTRSIGPDPGTHLPVEENVAWCIVGPEVRARFVLRGDLHRDREVRDERYVTRVSWITIPAPMTVATSCHPSKVQYTSGAYALVGPRPPSARSGARIDSLTASARIVRYSYLAIAGLGFILATGIFTIAGS